jgi:hypothetical protein
VQTDGQRWDRSPIIKPIAGIAFDELVHTMTDRKKSKKNGFMG